VSAPRAGVRAPGGLFYGWIIVGSASVVLLLAYAAHYSYGVFLAALLDEFGWRRAEVAGVFSVYVLVYCLMAFPAGRLTDGLGPRVVIATGGILLGGALMSVALVSRLWHLYVIYGLVAAFGMGTVYVPSSATVARWFVRRRGLASGVATMGQGIGTLGGPLVAQALVGAVGWRGAYLAFGAAVLGGLVLAALFMRRSPEDVGQRPDGESSPATAVSALEGWSLGQAARTRAFWMLATVFIVSWVSLFTPFVHLVRLAQDLGLSAMDGARAVSAIGAGVLVARPVMAWLSDRVGRKPVLVASVALQGLALLGFVGVEGRSGLYAAALAYGLAYGPVSSLFVALVADFFGRAHAGTLVGVLFAVAGTTTGVGPLLAGLSHDALGTYAPAFLAGAALDLLAAALLVTCRAPGLAPTPSASPV
jgi:MFS family permease